MMPRTFSEREGGQFEDEGVSSNPSAMNGAYENGRLDPEAGLPQHLPLSRGSTSSYEVERSLVNFTRYIHICLGLCVLGLVLALFIFGFRSGYLVFVLVICMGSFAFALYLMRWISSKDDNHADMKRISEAIREGAEGFLSTQYSTIATFAVLVAGVLFVIYMFRDAHTEEVSKSTLAGLTAASFLVGAVCSALAGYLGVWTSVRVNIRVAIAAAKLNYPDALLLAFRGGAVASVLSASMCILGISLLYILCHAVFVLGMGMAPEHVPTLFAGYGFGASFVALFMQLGGGIYTKAADVGADMCGKVEANIPEDDPRNPAVIADLVGDNVGDCAGSMADVFESIAAEIIGTMILGGTLATEAKIPIEPFIFFPLVIHGFDLVISAVGIMTVKPRGDESPIVPMKRSYGISMILAVVAFFLACFVLLRTPVAPSAWWHFGLCGVIGIVTSYLLIVVTQYYTDYAHDPVKRIAAASQTGHGTNVIAGVSVGMESTALPVLIICVAILCSYSLGKSSGLPGAAAGVYGTALATMGMLCTAVYILSMNNFGPIADNAGGIVEMSHQPEQVRTITDRLDAVGNVTKAASKGFAVGGSATACFVLFQAFLDEISMVTKIPFNSVDIAKVEVVLGGMLGIMMVFLFTGWAIKAVGTTAQQVVWEVRRQLKSKPGIMNNTERPDYGACVRIVTKAALVEMIKPAVLALGLPIVVGLVFKYIGNATDRPMLGIEVVAGFLMFGTLTGLLMAIFLDNSGGAWDNAKKLIESQGKKGTDVHKAAVTGDTVGDPFKDTAGPALHVIITTMSTTILVLGPMFIGTKSS